MKNNEIDLQIQIAVPTNVFNKLKDRIMENFVSLKY